MGITSKFWLRYLTTNLARHLSCTVSKAVWCDTRCDFKNCILCDYRQDRICAAIKNDEITNGSPPVILPIHVTNFTCIHSDKLHWCIATYIVTMKAESMLFLRCYIDQPQTLLYCLTRLKPAETFDICICSWRGKCNQAWERVYTQSVYYYIHRVTCCQRVTQNFHTYK